MTISFLHPNNNKGSLEKTPLFPHHRAFPPLSGHQPPCYHLPPPTLGLVPPSPQDQGSCSALSHHHYRQPFVLPTSDTDHTDATARFSLPMSISNSIISTQHRVQHYLVIRDDPTPTTSPISRPPSSPHSSTPRIPRHTSVF